MDISVCATQFSLSISLSLSSDSIPVFIVTPSLTLLSSSFKYATGAGLEVGVGTTWRSVWAWHGEIGVVCLVVVCEFQVSFGFDFRCLTVVKGLIFGGF